MVKRNSHFTKLQAGYLFPEIQKRKSSFLAQYPHAKLINLGVGNTTRPLPTFIVEKLAIASQNLGNLEGYSGYGPEQGAFELRDKIAQQIYKNNINADEIYVSDGMKCDLGRFQLLFGPETTIALQDPTYPVYVDTSVMCGKSKDFDPEKKRYHGIVYMPCNPENQFFPTLNTTPRTDLIYFCSPNNPTGTAATFQQLQQLVEFASEKRAIILYDAAYASYIQDSTIPRSIYEIPGARKVAIEMGSFSKMAGFTGLRLGWSVIPQELQFDDGTPLSQDWSRIHHTFFNGASNIVQLGGIAALENEGIKQLQQIINYYQNNAQKLKTAFQAFDLPVYGGDHAPYVWVNFFPSRSWDIFDRLLKDFHLVTTPGSGFGSEGEGYLRFSAFGSTEDIDEALYRLQRLFS